MHRCTTRRFARLIAGALLAAALVPAAAHAAVVEMSLAELARSADAVVVVNVTGSSVRDASKGRGKHPEIVTDTRVKVNRVLAGDRRPDFSMTQPGGELGDEGLAVTDIPTLAPGEQCVLFLDAGDRVIGGYQGKLTVERGRVEPYGITVTELARRIATYRAGGATITSASDWAPFAAETFGLAPGSAEYGAASLYEPATLVEPASSGITAITPAKQIAGIGATVSIQGSGFGSTKGTVTVTDGVTLPAARRDASPGIISWSNTEIVVVVPQYTASGPVQVTTASGTMFSATYDVNFSVSGQKVAPGVFSYYINENCPDMTGEGAEIIKSFDTWNAAGSKFQVGYAGARANTALRNGVNEVWFESSPEGYLAVNYYRYTLSDRRIFESDIIFNDRYTWGANATSNVWDVQSVALHEVGHTVGLDDQYTNTWRVMGAASPGKNRRALSADEIAGARYVNGATDPVPTLPVLASSTHPVQTSWYSVANGSLTFTSTSEGEVAGYSYVLDQSATTEPDTVTETSATSYTAALPEGERWFHVRAVGTNGLAGPTAHYRLRTDRTAPVGTVQIGPASGFTNTTSLPVTASLTDAVSGIANMRVDVGSGYSAWGTYAANHTATLSGTDGARTVQVQYRDGAGNVRTDTRAIVLDRVAPVTTSDAVSSYLESATVTLAATDAVSGVASTHYSLNGGPLTAYTGAIQVNAPGNYTLSFHSLDRAGNAEKTVTRSFTVYPEGTVFSDDPAAVTRLAGSDRYVVAARVAREAFPGWEGVTDVVIASGEDRASADPLSSAGLAGAYDAPVLLVREKLASGRLPTSTENAIAAIKSANGGKVRFHVVGGTRTIPGDVYNRLSALKGTGGSVTRISAADRYALSAEIAKRMVSHLGAQNIPGVLIANGQDSAAFYDALAASPVSYRTHRPLLLTPRSSVAPSVKTLLATTLYDKPRTAVNAPGWLSPTVTDSLGATQRMAASTLRRTAAIQIADHALAQGWLGIEAVAVANKLPDALTGGSAMGRLSGPLLYTDADTLCTQADGWLDQRKAVIRNVYIVGGEASVSPAAFQGVQEAVK